MMIKRHQLIYTTSVPQIKINTPVDTDINADITQTVYDWFAQGLPAIVTTQQTILPPVLAAGLCLVINNKKQRIPLIIEKKDIQRVVPGIKLTTIIPASLSYPLAIMPEVISVYGSFLWQYLSCMQPLNPFDNTDYITIDSDLDLCIDYVNFSLHQLQLTKKNLAQKLKRRIDGEVRFTEGEIAMNELLNVSTKTLLIKNSLGVQLISRAQLYELYPALC